MAGDAMTRGALLPTPGDPFVLRFWLDFFEQRWGKEVTGLYVDVNTPPWMPSEASAECMVMLENTNKTVPVSYTQSRMTNHGESINRLLDDCGCEAVMLCEDDAPVIKPGKVDLCFTEIELGRTDIIGSPRMSCSPIIYEATKAKYDLSLQPPTDIGPNWWPCFFFIKRNHLLRTDQHFGAKGWKVGERIEQLDITATEPIGSDTFVWASIQLRAMGLRVAELCQYHSYPHDLELWGSRQHLWNGRASWLHIGSLSGLVGTAPDQCMFADPKDFAAYIGRLKIVKDQCKSTAMELTRRYAWVSLIWERTHERMEGLGHLRDVWYQNLNICIDGLDLHRGVMEALINAYRELLA